MAPLQGRVVSAGRFQFIPPDQHTSGRSKRDRGIGCGLRQSIHRLAAGQRVLMAITSCAARPKPIGTQTCASFKRPVSVQRRGAHKDGLSCNRGSTQNITGSRIRHDDSKDSVALLRLAKGLHQGLAQWTGMAQKRRLLGQRISCLNCNRVALSKSEIDGCRRCACVTISLGAGCSCKRSLGVVGIPQRRRC